MTSWKNNASFDDWKTSLRELLDDARKAVNANDDDAVDAVYGDLENFIVASDDTIAGVAELDRVARQTMRDLVVDAVQRNVQAIADRTADVAELEKRFAKESAANNSIAAGLRLERVRAVLDASTQTIASLRALAEALPTATDPDAAKLEKQINDVIAALGKLHTAVQPKP
jgi:adenine-specific DNA methylase